MAEENRVSAQKLVLTIRANMTSSPVFTLLNGLSEMSGTPPLFSPDDEDSHEGGHDFSKSMCTMLVGLIDGDGRALGDTEVAPYKEMKYRKSLVPTSAQYRAEVDRRASTMEVSAPQCKYWSKEKLLTWLKKNPVDVLLEREWLLREERKIYNGLQAAEEEKEGVTTGNNNWGDIFPWLRLYCCLYDDRTRPYFNSKDDVMNRQELDARNNNERPLTLYEFIAELFNDPDNTYTIEAKPDLHPTFAEPITVGYDLMPRDIDADEAKKRLADARAKLMRIIANWERSGNGFGQREETDEQYGHMEEEQLEDGDNRASFLDGIGKEHLLIL